MRLLRLPSPAAAPLPSAPRRRHRSFRAFAAATVAAALLCGAGPTSAWSARGHSMVGDIATRLLTPAATAAVADLLQGDLSADGKPSGRMTLAEVASWPDELRAMPEQRATGVYHYDDLPICGVPDRAIYCKDGQCATAWFEKQLKIVNDPAQPRRARNEALKWIVHLVGDVHQPLHASDHDDKGGNDVEVTFFGKRADDPVDGRTPSSYNLHTAWDRLIPNRMDDERGGYDRFLADLPSAATRPAWSVGDIRQWTEESYVLSRDFLYPALPVAFVCEKPVTEVAALGEAYERPAGVIAAMQLQKAGVRLAKVLNDVFPAR